MLRQVSEAPAREVEPASGRERLKLIPLLDREPLKREFWIRFSERDQL